MHRRRTILAALLIPAAAGVGQGPRVTIDANIPPPTTFTHHLPFAELPEGVRSVVFAPDREVLYAHYPVRVIDAWSVLVYYWPEVLGGVLALVGVLLMIVAWRIKRRPQTAGAPHCRRCNYDLSPQISRDAEDRFVVPGDARCPECGVVLAKRRPVRGRRTRRRLAPIAGVAVLLAAGYGAMHVAGAPRNGRVSGWGDWSSSSLAELAAEHGIAFLTARVVTGDRIVEVDLGTGRISRVVATRRSSTWTALAVTPDGRGLIIAGDAPGTLQVVSTSSGRRLGHVTLPERESPLGAHTRSVVGFSAEGKTAYVQWAGRERGVGGVSGWNLETGELTTVAETASYLDSRGGRPVPYGRPFFLRGVAPVRLLSIPSFMEAFPTQQYTLRFHDQAPASGDERPFTLDPMPSPSNHPALTADGRMLFVVSQYGEQILGVDLETREVVGGISAGRARHFNESLVLSNDSRLLLVGSFPNTLLVRDIGVKRWLAALRFPEELYAPVPSISRDNRWVAVVAQSGTKGVFRHEVVIWNLAEILATSQHAQPVDAETP